MDEKHLLTLSKEELFDQMIKTMDELFSLLKDQKNEDKADQKRHEMHLLRTVLDKVDKSNPG